MRFQQPSNNISALFIEYLHANPAVKELKVLLLSDSSQSEIGRVVTLNPIQAESCNYEYCVIFNRSLFEQLPIFCRRIMAKQLILLLENHAGIKSEAGCKQDLWKPFLSDKTFFKDMALLEKHLSVDAVGSSKVQGHHSL